MPLADLPLTRSLGRFVAELSPDRLADGASRRSALPSVTARNRTARG